MYYRYYDKKDNRLKNYYKLLGIPRNFDESSLHEHFASLHQEGKTNELIEEAYAVLSNPEDRDRYNRVYDRYNWNYGIQKNSLYEKTKPKHRGRTLFLLFLLVLIGFITIAYFFFRAPEATAPQNQIETPVQPQAEAAVEPELNSSGESEEAESSDLTDLPPEPATESSETESALSEESTQTLVALSVSDEILAAYPEMELNDSLDNLYPKAQVSAGVNFRNAPTMDSAVLSSVGTDETFLVLGKVGGWSYIYRESQGYGWIGGKYIRFID